MDLERYSHYQAKQVVRAHTGKKGSRGHGWLGRKGRDITRPDMKKQRRVGARIDPDTDTDSEDVPDIDIEATAAHSSSNTHRMGRGILTALLSLYDHNNSLLNFSNTSTVRSSLDVPDPTPETMDNTRRNAGIDVPERPWLHHHPQRPPVALPVPETPPSAPLLGSKLAPSPEDKSSR
jgi:hypothetical protein